MTALIVLMLCVQIALLCVVVVISRELRCLRELTASQRRPALTVKGDLIDLPHLTNTFFDIAYSIWCWRVCQLCLAR